MGPGAPLLLALGCAGPMVYRLGPCSHCYRPQVWAWDRLWGRLHQVAGSGLAWALSGDHDVMHGAPHDASAGA